MSERRTVVALSLAVAMVLLVCALVRTTFWTYGADTGTLAIAIQNLPNGMHNQFEHSSHFRFHWSPILATLYPLLVITHSVLALQIIQIVLVIGAVVAYYFLIERHLGKALALRCAVVALLYPPLIGLAFSEFHELAFAPLLTLLALLALSAREWTWYALSVMFLLCVKEDVALMSALYGGVIAVAGFRRSDRPLAIAGILTAGAGAIVVIAYFAIIVPRLGGWGPAGFYAGTYAPGLGRITYFLEMIVPLALLPLRTRWFWFVIPGLAVILLTNSADVWRMGMHYVALWLPWVLIAMAAGLAQLRVRAGEQTALRWSWLAAGLCIVFLVVANPLHLGHYLRPSYVDIAAVNRVMRCVPPGELLGTHDEWYSAMAFVHPNETIGAPTYARYLLFADDYPNVEYQTKIAPLVRGGIASGKVLEICRVNRVAVYRRTQP